MELTKEIFDVIEDDEIFKIVITRLQTVYEPFRETLKFVCKKDTSGLYWAIYAGRPHQSDEDIKLHGDKVKMEANIRGLCPCSDEIFSLYRY